MGISFVEVEKKKKVALPLCIFGGFLGLHRFYEGKLWTGVFYLLSLGLLGVGWIVDIILLCRKPAVYTTKRLNYRPFTLSYWGAESEHIDSILLDGETSLMKVPGLMNGKMWMIACTNKRIIFVERGLIYGGTQSEVLLRNVTSVIYNQRLIYGDILIDSHGTTYGITNVPSAKAKEFVEIVNIELARM